VRIPFPVHIPLSRVAAFAVLLFLIEIYQGTSLTFALFALLFILISGAAFNSAGGLSRPSGAYIFFYAVLAVILGLVCKAVLGEPADSNLLQPILTMQIYAGSITAMWGAALVSKKLSLRRPLLDKLVTDANIQDATYGCMATGLVVTLVMMMVEIQPGSMLSALAQVNRFLPMAIILGVIYEIRRTGGRKSINLPVFISCFAIFMQGIFGFSKEGLFTPFACWIIAAASQGYRLSRAQMAGLAFTLYFMVHFLVPYAQYGRNFFDPSFSVRAHAIVDLLEDLEGTRAKYLEDSADSYERTIQSYYDTSQGFMDRLQMISADDRLNDLTERVGVIGPMPIIMGLENLIPRFLWPNKPNVNFGNLYAHQMGSLAADDTTTGISFSAAGEAYHIGQWIGIFFWAPLLWIVFFTLFDSLCGDTRISPWGLLLCAVFAHIAPEGGIGGVIYSLGFIAFGLVFAAFAAAYVMPILGVLIKGPGQNRTSGPAVMHTLPRRARSLP
jgi:hypothetical protein